MKAAALSFALSLAFLSAQTNAWARDTVLPAGTLVTCTMDEPNFSSATAEIGDPVLCHPHGLQVFGQTVFPRGTYIVGHLADDKDPGHFWGKGYLKIEFDRIGLPGADVPLSAKMVAVSGGYKVDKEGKIKGKGHAKRDIAEWLFPPLWPWKIIMLPARGPRPTLKGESRVTLKLMEDVLVPDSAQWQRFGRLDPGGTSARPALYLRPTRIAPPSGLNDAVYRTVSWQSPDSGSTKPDTQTTTARSDDHSGWHSFRKTAQAAPAPQPAVTKPAAPTDDSVTEDMVASPKPSVTDAAPVPGKDDKAAAPDQPTITPVATSTSQPAAPVVTADSPALMKTVETESAPASATSAAPGQKPRLTLFALTSGAVYATTDYWRDEDRLVYVLPSGKEGQIEMSALDWKITTQLNAERSVKVTLRDGR